ncbi:MAG: pantetheine-phosphate adenylyltransferase [Candidatus Wallbacteria bacterium]|nr:pantetheine-phosphate adenylyltransferase [Candidatus Wallbacteria bacterium]
MKAIYPGSFDPVTTGHLDIISRSASLFQPLIVAVLENSTKETLFTPGERILLLREATKGIPGVEVESFNGLLIDYMKKKKSRIAIRGMRALSDFDYEYQMALTNKGLYHKMETVFLITKGEYAFISSSLVKELARLGGDVSRVAPACVIKALAKKYK